MKYADLAVPSRALHLWRYTPWARIHPHLGGFGSRRHAGPLFPC